MGVSEIYGVSSSDPGEDEPREDTENSVQRTEPVPDEERETQLSSDSDISDNQQTPPASSVSPPTQSAVAEIERLMASGAHPVDAATPFLTSATHAFDESLSDEDDPPAADDSAERGWFRRLLGGPARGEPSAAGPAVDADSDGADRTDDDGAADERRASRGVSRGLPVRPAHVAVAGVFAVSVLVAAVMLGRPAGPDTEVSAAAMAAAPEPAANPQLDRSQPIVVQKGNVEALCSPGSTDPFGAFSHEEGAAWKCLAPYNGVGQVLAVTLPDGPYVITEVRMMPGYDAPDKDGSDLWVKNRVVSKATWRFDDGTRVPQEFDGSRRQQMVTVPEAVTNKVTLTIQKTDAPARSQAPISASAPTPGVPGTSGIPKWLEGTNWLPSPTGVGQPASGDTSQEPQAFAVSSIEIVGYPVRTNSAR